MKVTYPRTILIQKDGQRPIRFTEASKAAEHWAKIKEQEWVEKHRDDVIYITAFGTGHYRRPSICNSLYDDGRIRYRKLKRRAQAIFRKILIVNS